MAIKNFYDHHTSLIKFLGLLSVLVAYFAFLSWKYDLVTGGVVSALTWSFFVLGTPIADAGFLLDFPVRLITGFKMIYSELCVWALAIGINIATLSLAPDHYDKTFITSLLHHIITTPWPYWGIIILCAIGTYLSIWFGDDVMDEAGKRDKNPKRKARWFTFAGLFMIIFGIYYLALRSIGIDVGQVL